LRDHRPVDRRRFLAAGAAAAAPHAVRATAPAVAGPAIERRVPRSGEPIASVGLGTWLTFHIEVGDAPAMARRRAVLERFFDGGGMLVDSSPMYASAEQVLGVLLGEIGRDRGVPRLVAASKVWTPFTAIGAGQMERSLALWRLPRFDLMQVHNLLNWRGHLATLRAWKEQGRARMLGVTTSHGNKHDEMRTVLLRESAALEFMQITYSPVDRRAEPLMQLAADRGLGVIVNRPFDGGDLLDRLAREPLPGLAAELGCTVWAQLVLKWELAHPAVTCAIPATTDPEHAAQNVAAMRPPLPDARQRSALGAIFDRILG
jgi:diketogulonate reductase-like aldo/keto reductase